MILSTLMAQIGVFRDKRKAENIMFDFRIIEMLDGNQIIDRNLKTPYNAITAVQMVEYVEVDTQLTIADRMKRKRQREEARRQKAARNPIHRLYRLACMYGLV